MHASRSDLINGGDLGSRCETFAGGDGISLYAAGLDVAEGCNGLVEGDVDVSARHVTDDVDGAGAVGNETKVSAGDLLEVDAAHVLARAGSPGTLRGFVRIGLEPGDQLLKVSGRQIVAGYEDVGIAGQKRNGRQILLEIVRQVHYGAVDDVGGPVADNDRVAVSWRPHYPPHSNRP